MKILSLGSLNIDHVYKVDHIVRPGETISCLSMQDFCGGKGLNQSIALARAGAAVYHAGKVGADGGMLTDRLRAAGVDTRYIHTEEGAPTGHAIIQVDAKGQNSIVIHAGANGAVTKGYIDEVMAGFEPGDLLLMQNEVSQLEYAIQKGHACGLQVALNPSPITQALSASPALALVDYLILNEIEGFEISGQKDAEAICRALQEQYPGCKVLLTLGRQGCVYCDGGRFARHGIYDVPVVDTTAAGDTFTGYFLACMAEGLPIDATLALASKASSLAVSRAGAADSIPLRAEAESASLVLRG